MKKFVLRLLSFISLITLFFAVPFYVLYFSGESFLSLRQAAFNQGLVGYAYNSSNYQAIKWLRLKEDDRFDIIALGSSRVLMFEEKMFKSRFYNAGYSVKTINDVLGFMNTIPEHKLPNELLLGLDQWMFNYNWSGTLEIRQGDYWRKQFKKSPSNDEIKSVYIDLFSSKISLRDIWYEDTGIGLNAIINRAGIRYDGSMDYGKELAVDGPDFNRTLDFIKKGENRFDYGEVVNQNAINDLLILLEFCKERKIHVTAILPPFPDVVFKELNNGRHEYIAKIYERIRPIFKALEFDLFDFTSVAHLGVLDSEFRDGFHGGKTVYSLIIEEIKNSKVQISGLIN